MKSISSSNFNCERFARAFDCSPIRPKHMRLLLFIENSNFTKVLDVHWHIEDEIYDWKFKKTADTPF